MATQDQLRRSIDPGSIPYGQRQGLESALSGLTPQAGPSPGGAAPTPGGNLGIPANPLDAMLGGMVKPGQGNITDGLGPQAGRDPLLDSRVERLRLIANSAKSPVLRELAARALPGLVQELRNDQ